MKSRKSSLTLKSFQEIKTYLQAKSISLPDQSRSGSSERQIENGTQSEEELFVKAMEGVTPIARDNLVEKSAHVERPESFIEKEEAEALAMLENLVKRGTGFDVSNTPEYIEGTGYNVHPSLAQRLHRGDFSIQAYVDLHGFTLSDAKEAFEKFMKWSITQGKTGVLIVHGRGLSSPSEPVLKKSLVEWLTRGPYRKWVMAYSSARICDGGAGATYVLLRKRPLSKRLRKSRKIG